MPEYIPTVLSIAGLDPYAGAGIQVDTKVIHALGGYAFSVVSVVTSQNSTGVKGVWTISGNAFKLQLQTLLDDIKVDAVKIGMLYTIENIRIVAEVIKKYKLENIVLDTILESSSGKGFLEPDAMKIMVEELFPLVDIITPNIPEVNRLLGTNFNGNHDEIQIMADKLFLIGVQAVLIKGGHSSDKKNSTDYFVTRKESTVSFSSQRLHTTHTHGTGCVLSSAIATGLAKNETMVHAIQNAKNFIYKALQSACTLNFKYIEKNINRKEPLL